MLARTRFSTTGRRPSAPFRIVMPTPQRRFDPDADREQDDDLKKPDERVDRIPGEGARFRPAGDGLAEATLHHAIELDMFPHNQRDCGGEDHRTTRDIAENRL